MKTLAYWIRAISYGRYGDLGILLLRLIPGILMAYTHGWGKITHYKEYSADFYNFLGLGSDVSYMLIILAEFICSILILLGLFTRLASIPLIIAMAVIVFDVNAGKQIYEFETPLLYMIIFLVLMITGAGKYSLDYSLYHKRTI